MHAPKFLLVIAVIVLIILALGAGRTVISRIYNHKELEAGATERNKNYVKTTLVKASDAGQTVVVAARTGDKLSEGDCIVDRSQTAPFASANDGAHVSDTVQFYLNCNGGYATATTPGLSQGSEEGRAAKSAADEEEAKAQAEAQAAQDATDELIGDGQSPGTPGE